MTEEPKTLHKCPNCGYIVSDVELKCAKFDYLCPRCRLKTLSSFEIIREND